MNIWTVVALACIFCSLEIIFGEVKDIKLLGFLGFLGLAAGIMILFGYN